MFAKVFGQIFDSSIAEDYNCRRMFMDLLVLADPTGAVDMTLEAIARRTNVPIDECRKYITELCQPDPTSRSKLEEGKRLVPLDSKRDWGWKIVNYGHYRKIKDEEARRSYFRDASRRYRARKKGVFDADLTNNDNIARSLTPSSTSSSVSVQGKEGTREKPLDAAEVINYARSIGLPESDGHYYFDKWESNGYKNGGERIKDWRKVISAHKAAGYCPSQKRGLQASSFQKPKLVDPNQQRLDDEYERHRKEQAARKGK